MRSQLSRDCYKRRSLGHEDRVARGQPEEYLVAGRRRHRGEPRLLLGRQGEGGARGRGPGWGRLDAGRAPWPKPELSQGWRLGLRRCYNWGRGGNR